ncbi:hypothetical protein HNR73_004306 [Phytomonospora endophytica]|uniref:Uncharacterized protein n=1 Tax=Phytomonospora endophytica TaxID=714109 RepID=A0A841FKL8_9ACTN|nr:hypothetical protein [Phytomonospora endophytica]
MCGRAGDASSRPCGRAAPFAALPRADRGLAAGRWPRGWQQGSAVCGGRRATRGRAMRSSRPCGRAARFAVSRQNRAVRELAADRGLTAGGRRQAVHGLAAGRSWSCGRAVATRLAAGQRRLRRAAGNARPGDAQFATLRQGSAVRGLAAEPRGPRARGGSWSHGRRQAAGGSRSRGGQIVVLRQGGGHAAGSRAAPFAAGSGQRAAGSGQRADHGLSACGSRSRGKAAATRRAACGLAVCGLATRSPRSCGRAAPFAATQRARAQRADRGLAAGGLQFPASRQSSGFAVSRRAAGTAGHCGRRRTADGSRPVKPAN